MHLLLKMCLYSSVSKHLENVSIDQCFYMTLKISTTTVPVKHESWYILLTLPILKIITSPLILPVSRCRGFILATCNTLHVKPQVISYAPNSQKSQSFVTKQHTKDHFLCLLKSMIKPLLSSKGTGSC